MLKATETACFIWVELNAWVRDQPFHGDGEKGQVGF